MFLAPNGKKSNLTPEQYKLVRTPEFKEWFGDWENDPANASKVIDENGEPLVVYHYSNNDFNIFRTNGFINTLSGSEKNYGVYFTNNDNDRDFYLKLKGNYEYECFIKIINPFNNDDYRWSSIINEQRLSFLIENNFDGVITKGSVNEWIVLKSEQIKLADGSNTTFDMNNPDIRYDEGGLITEDKIEVFGLDNYTSSKKSGRFYHIYAKRKIGDELDERWWIRFSRKDGVNNLYYIENEIVNTNDNIEIYFPKKKLNLSELPKSLLDIYNNPDIRFKEGGRTISQTPAPKKDRIKGSKVNPKGSASSEKSAEKIKLSTSIIASLIKKLNKFKETHKTNKVSLNDLKAVYRRGLGAYSTSHRPNITRNGWAMGRVNAFLSKAGGGEHKEAYVQDDDLMKMNNGGDVGQEIKCRRCGWNWNTKDSEEYDKYVCHNCGFDNRTFYDVDPIGYADGGLLSQQGTFYTKDKNKKLEYYKKGNNYAFKVYDVENNTNEYEAIMNYNQFINYLYSELYIDDKYADGGEVDDKKKIYEKWKSLVNMSYGEIKKFYDSKEGKEAGLSTSEANKQGISSGRESARMLMKMKTTPKDKWTDEMWRWANKQISFISRMSGMQGELYDDNGNKTRKHTSLLIWGHNPKKNTSMKYDKGGETEINDFAKNSKFKVSKSNDYTFFNINADKQIRITKMGGKYNRGYRVTLHQISKDGITYKSEYLINDYASDLQDAKKVAGKIYFDVIREGASEEIDIADKDFDYSKIPTDELKKMREKTNDFSEMASILKELNYRKNNPDKEFADGGEMDVRMEDTVQRMDNPNFADISYYDKGALIPQQGTLFTKDKKSKLEYYKKGNDYAFKVYDVENNPVQNYTRNQYKNRGKDEVLMTYNQFIKYLDSELYIDSKKMADGGELQGLTQNEIDTNVHKIATKTNLPLQYINSQLKLGIKFEMEHTKNVSIASKIALDHLNESPYYYQKLQQMEKELNSMESKKNVYLHDNNNTMSENTLFKQGGDLKYDSANVKEYFAHGSGNVGGVLVGKRHSEGGIKAVNKSTGQPLEMEGGEVVITRKAVSDEKKREFEGEMLTNKEILSRINESGGGVKIFSEGGDIESDTCSCSGKSYKYGGKMMVDYDIAKHISNMQNETLESNHHNSLKNNFFPVKEEFTIVETNDGAIAEVQTDDRHEMFLIKSSELNFPEGLPILEVGTTVYSVESNGTMNEWKIEYFTQDSVILSHKPKHKLHHNFENKIISFDELKEMFKNGHIQIKGVNNERELGLVLELLKAKINTTTNFKDGGLVFTEYEKEDEEVIEKQFGNKKI